MYNVIRFKVGFLPGYFRRVCPKTPTGFFGTYPGIQTLAQGRWFLAASPPHVHVSLSYCLLTTWSYSDNQKNSFLQSVIDFQKQTILTFLMLIILTDYSVPPGI